MQRWLCGFLVWTALLWGRPCFAEMIRTTSAGKAQESSHGPEADGVGPEAADANETGRGQEAFGMFRSSPDDLTPEDLAFLAQNPEAVQTAGVDPIAAVLVIAVSVTLFLWMFAAMTLTE